MRPTRNTLELRVLVAERRKFVEAVVRLSHADDLRAAGDLLYA